MFIYIRSATNVDISKLKKDYKEINESFEMRHTLNVSCVMPVLEKRSTIADYDYLFVFSIQAESFQCRFHLPLLISNLNLALQIWIPHLPNYQLWQLYLQQQQNPQLFHFLFKHWMSCCFMAGKCNIAWFFLRIFCFWIIFSLRGDMNFVWLEKVRCQNQ